MKTFQDKLKTAQQFLMEKGLGGWLLYDFKRLNPLACHFLEITDDQLLTRRFFYWIPSQGEAVKLVSAVENPLSHLPGLEKVFHSWKELDELLSSLLRGVKTIVMEYSPLGRTPEVSKVDAGTLELIRSFGVEVLSSGDLYQQLTCLLSPEQVDSHRRAARLLERVVDETWAFLRQNMGKVTEKEAQAFISARIKEGGCRFESPPIVAAGEHSAAPHWIPDDTLIKPGDFVLIDLWCKEAQKEAVYADITRVAVLRGQPSQEEERVFRVVKQAQSFATELVIGRFRQNKPVFGWEVDQAARVVIEDAGFGPYFVHRTGHNIFESDHGPGCHNDNLETQEQRVILKGTCCSIEPGIYLPKKFGIRLEYDLLIGLDGRVEITGGVQEKIACIF